MGFFGWLRSFFGHDTLEVVADRPAPAILPSRAKRTTVGVGVNLYADSPENALRGCEPDARNVRRALEGRGWVGGGMLLDGRAPKRKALELVGNAAADLRRGEALLVQWSSHGTHAQDPREPDGIVEAICPHDAMLDWPRNLITAYDLADCLRNVVPGALVVLLVDACHSGVPTADAGRYRALSNPHPEKARLLQPPAGVPIPATIGRPLRRLSGAVEGQVATPWTRTVLLSGCESGQTSADAWIEGGYQGAMTHAFLAALRAGNRSLAEIHGVMRRSLRADGYSQRPQLEGAATHFSEALF